jgi:tetratricopeptide (TPR) repeat protein
VNVNDPNVIGAATVVTIVAGALAMVEFVWKPIRGFRHRNDPPLATREDIQRLEKKLALPAEFLDGLPEAVDKKLRAAYEEARLLQLEGYQAQNADKHQEAIDRFTRALGLAENDSQRAALHSLRGNSYHSISEYGKAAADHEETLKLSKCMSPKDAASARSAALGNLGLVYQGRGDLDKAEGHHKQALDINREIGYRLGEASQLGNLGNVYFQRGELEKAEDHHKQALEIHRDIGDRLGEARDLGNLGIVYGQRGRPGDLDKAEEHFKEALTIDREIGDRLGEAHDLGNLGNVYGLRGGPGDLDKAEEHYKQILEIHREIGDRLGQAHDLGNLGNVYLLRGGPGDLDKAEEHYGQALEIHSEIGNRLGQAHDLGNLGVVYALRGEFDKAKEHSRQAKSIFEATGARSEADQTRQALERIEELERQQREGGKEERSEG